MSKDNEPSRYTEYKVFEYKENKKDGSFTITEKKPVLDGEGKPKVVSIYPHEADIMNNGVNGKPNEVAVKTKRYYEPVKQKAKKDD